MYHENEYEIISHPQINALNILLVRMISRTPHSHKELEIGYIIEGSVTLITKDTSYTLHANNLYVINPMEFHEIRTDGNSTLILAIQMSHKLISSYFIQMENSYFIENNIAPFFTLHEQRYEILKGLCLEMAYNYFGQFPNYELKCMSLLNMILYILNTYVPQKVYSDTELAAKLNLQKRLSRITDYIEKNFQRKLLLNEIADSEQLSLTYLSHFFKEHMKMSFQEYLNLRRFEYASMLLLNTNKKVLSISLESGFSDVRYLNQLCQKYYSCSPLEIRKKRQAASTTKELSSNSQSFYNNRDSVLLLSSLRSDNHQKYEAYSIWDFFR